MVDGSTTRFDALNAIVAELATALPARTRAVLDSAAAVAVACARVPELAFRTRVLVFVPEPPAVAPAASTDAAGVIDGGPARRRHVTAVIESEPTTSGAVGVGDVPELTRAHTVRAGREVDGGRTIVVKTTRVAQCACQIIRRD